jgi:uncharacterized alkaline shock family protein YloU
MFDQPKGTDMADSTTTTAPQTQATTPPASASPSTEIARAESSGPLVTTQGRTSIADAVVSKIAGIATREVSGVHDLGGNTARAVGALRDRIPGSRTNLSQGVNVEVGERQAAVDVDLIAEYGVSIAELASGVRRNVIGSVERMTGLEVTEVNITVLDVHLEGDDTDQPSESRVE